ncbi:type I-F CRISPR-associated endoribonuclease Cas6/Csy4 [Sulfurimonas sp.]
MFVAQITFPQTTILNETKGVSLKPDMALVNQVFSLLHLNAFRVDKEYKYIVGFPLLQKDNIGRVLHLFSEKESDLKKHIKTEKLYNLLTGYCNIKIVKLTENILKEQKRYQIRKTKDDNFISLSKIKRTIKRGSANSKIVEFHKQGLNAIAIQSKLKKENQKSWLFYKNSKNNNCSFFLEKIKSEKEVALDTTKVNGFGLSRDIVLPDIIF